MTNRKFNQAACLRMGVEIGRQPWLYTLVCEVSTVEERKHVELEIPKEYVRMCFREAPSMAIQGCFCQEDWMCDVHAILCVVQRAPESDRLMAEILDGHYELLARLFESARGCMEALEENAPLVVRALDSFTRRCKGESRRPIEDVMDSSSEDADVALFELFNAF